MYPPDWIHSYTVLLTNSMKFLMITNDGLKDALKLNLQYRKSSKKFPRKKISANQIHFPITTRKKEGEFTLQKIFQREQRKKLN